MSLVKELLEWGATQKTTLNPDVEIYQDPITGLSFRAKHNIPPESNIVTCSYQTSLSYLNAIQEPHFPSRSQPLPQTFLDTLEENDPNIIGHFFLMQQYLIHDQSFWYQYIRLLPQPDDPKSLGIPIWWPDEDRKFLAGTNAEPAIQKRQDLWKEEWARGVELVGDETAVEKYSYGLYQWAATIFGSRSFRPSLTIAHSLMDGERVLENVKMDRFSILLPIMDIGNHNGEDNASWLADKERGLSLSNKTEIAAGNQVYNFYGDKSNSELLVAYGFTLPNPRHDRVNLKLKPSPSVIHLYRQLKHEKSPKVKSSDEEFMFIISAAVDWEAIQVNPTLFQDLPDPLIEIILIMVANRRELRYMTLDCKGSLLDATSNLELLQFIYQTLLRLSFGDWLFSTDNTEQEKMTLPSLENVLQGPLYRAALHTLHVICSKLESEISRIKETGHELGEPRNHNQIVALDYRNRQQDVLEKNSRSNSLTAYTAMYTPSTTPSFCRSNENTIHIISLSGAFAWLQETHPSIHDPLIQLIASDQEEDLPLNWSVLVEDWDNTYWITFITIIFFLRQLEPAVCVFSVWIDEVTLAADKDVLYAEKGEVATIDMMVGNILKLPEFEHPRIREYLSRITLDGVRNLASFVVREETFPMCWSEEPLQKVLCIRLEGTR